MDLTDASGIQIDASAGSGQFTILCPEFPKGLLLRAESPAKMGQWLEKIETVLKVGHDLQTFKLFGEIPTWAWW